MTEYQLLALVISALTAVAGAASIYYVTQWLDAREERRPRSAAE